MKMDAEFKQSSKLNHYVIDQSLNVRMVAEIEIYHKLFYFWPQPSQVLTI